MASRATVASALATPLYDASDVHAFVPFATAVDVRRAALETPARTEMASLSIRALLSVFDADVKGAIALLRRALRRGARHGEERAYVKDILLHLLASAGDFDAMQRLFDEPGNVPRELVPLFQSTEALLAAVRGDARRSRALERRALTAARRLDTPLSLCRVLSRCANAAYHREDYDEARELALESAHVFESHEAYSGAVWGYSVAGTVAQDWNGDGALAAFYFQRMSDMAGRARSGAFLRSALAARLNVAAERFEPAACASLRTALLSQPVPPQLQENHIMVIADVLVHGWNAEFSAAQAALESHARDPRLPQQQLALAEALLSLVDVARWDVDAARRRSRSALERTARGPASEPLHARRSRELARVLAAATCLLIGDRVRGERALSARFDPDHRYRELLAARPIATDRFPDLLRGYAEFVRVAAEHAERSRPRHGLTAAETQVLRLLRSGSTLAQIALELRKSKSTVARQVESIYEKLEVRNRAHAIERGRELGLFA